MRYVPQLMGNQQAEILMRSIEYYKKLAADPKSSSFQVRLYWRIIRQMRADLANIPE